MKKFKYGQASYLRYIEHLRNEALLASKDAEAFLEKIREKIVKNEEKITTSFEKNASYGTDHSTIHDVQDTNLFIQQVRNINAGLQSELESAEQDYQDKMQKLMALQQELKALEKHKEYKQDEHSKKARKKAQKVTDEINSLRYGENHG